VAPDRANVLGVLSLIFWSITLVVTFKYLFVLMRADNRGEGGIMALFALAPPEHSDPAPGRIGLVALMVLAGAALLFGDGIITPAISVLSAMEGLEVATTALKPAVIPLTVLILVGLFAVQRHGTARLGRFFGPAMLVWFLMAGVLGAVKLVQSPGVLAALSPAWAISFFSSHGFGGVTILGGVVLCVTGGEALYADMGHFGRGPIRMAWLCICLPCLVLCYFGQGAALLAHPEYVAQPFYALCPRGPWVIPFVVVAAVATVIASQALITGVFSLSSQAMHLGFFPRMRVQHTSDETQGQIYVPAMNWGLALACVALVLVFKRSAALAAAFGLAVSGTMLLTSVVFYVVVRRSWNWPLWKAGGLLVIFLSFDIPFLVGNCLKFFDGGYLPFLVGALFLVVMVNWRLGRGILKQHLQGQSLPMDVFLQEVHSMESGRLPGTGVYLSSVVEGAPLFLVRLVRNFRALHERGILLTVRTEDRPFVPPAERSRVEVLAPGFFRVFLSFGFRETPDVPEALAPVLARLPMPSQGPRASETVFILGDETLTEGPGGKFGTWAERLYSVLNRNASKVSLYFHLPPERVVSLGSYIDL
jgi:KUP system potassium uptake protein